MIRKFLERLIYGNQPGQSAAATKVAALSDIGELDRAIKIVAAAMPEFATGSPSINSGHSAEDVVRGLIDGSSLILSCDFEVHPTHAIMAIPQPNGRLRLSIVRRDSFFTEGRI